jgi:hypothetical protein
MSSRDFEILRLSYEEGPKSLHVRVGDIVFWIDGIERTFKSPLHAQLVAALGRAYPGTVSVEEIFENLRAYASIGSPMNLESTVHKYVHGTRQDLLAAGLRMDVIRNVRGHGYRLAQGWSVERPMDSASLAEAELQEIRSLVQKCIAHVESRRIVTNRGGLTYVEADPAVVHENMVLLDRIGWQLIHSLCEVEIVPDILDIKRDLSVLLSYALFWRVGHRISVEDWKQDYRIEIQKTCSDIEMRIQKIKNYFERRDQNQICIKTLSPSPASKTPMATLKMRSF